MTFGDDSGCTLLSFRVEKLHPPEKYDIRHEKKKFARVAEGAET